MPSIEPTPEQFAAFLQQVPADKPIVMINLLRYREQAEYPAGYEASPCTGREAYQRYGEQAIQHVAKVGGKPIWMGSAQAVVIGPSDETWDDAVLVEYPSRQAFMEMVAKPDYQECAVHRTAALADSRLIATLTVASGLAAD
jgi:uncharacterized protein (DUF1330 family)